MRRYFRDREKKKFSNFQSRLVPSLEKLCPIQRRFLRGEFAPVNQDELDKL